MKRCSKCGQTRPLADFSRCSASSDGLDRWCRECKARSYQAWAAGHRPPATRTPRLGRSATLARQAQWREVNREKLRQQERDRYDANREQVLAQLREYREKALEHYGRSCACCGSTDHPEIDHIHGGGTAHRRVLGISGGYWFCKWLADQGFPDGYQTLCRPCNRSKADGQRCRLDHGGTQ
ncbi:MAG: hypothetical protein ACRDOK_25130 [Streptosporangiaceae bacterium]